MRRQLAQAGFGAQPNITPGEFLSMHTISLSDRPRLRGALQQVTNLYIQAAYTSTLPKSEDVKAAQHRWRNVWPDRVRLWLRTFTRRLRQPK